MRKRLLMKSRLGIIFLGLLFGAASCSPISIPALPWSSQRVEHNPTAEALFAEGIDHFNNKRYSRAIDRLQRVKAEFPFSSQLTEAELKLAEAYYLNRQYPEAIAAFKEFQTLHPTNENIPFARRLAAALDHAEMARAPRAVEMIKCFRIVHPPFVS